VVASDFSGIFIWRGNGNGTFAFHAGVSGGSNNSSLAVADVNFDGLLDIAYFGSSDGMVFVRLASAPGIFGSARGFQVYENPGAIELSDVTGDGVIDLLVAHDSRPILSVFVGDSDRIFNERIDFASGRTSSFSSSLAVADFDSDSQPDVAVGDQSIAFPCVSVLLNRTQPGESRRCGRCLVREWNRRHRTESANDNFLNRSIRNQHCNSAVKTKRTVALRDVRECWRAFAFNYCDSAE
jgi:hypothetical protein